MRVYQIKDGEVIREFDNVKQFGRDFVLYDNNGNLGKTYADEGEYFTDTPVEAEEEADE